MKQALITAFALLLVSTGANAQSANGRMHGRGHGRTTTTTTTTNKKVKQDVNRAGHMNNGDNGDKNNNRGKGDKNNR